MEGKKRRLGSLLFLVCYFNTCLGKAVLDESPNFYGGNEYTYNFQSGKHEVKPLYDERYFMSSTESQNVPQSNMQPSHELNKMLEEYYNSNVRKEGKTQVNHDQENSGDVYKSPIASNKKTSKIPGQCTDCDVMPPESTLNPAIKESEVFKKSQKPKYPNRSKEASLNKRKELSRKYAHSKYDSPTDPSNDQSQSKSNYKGSNPYIKVTKRKKYDRKSHPTVSFTKKTKPKEHVPIVKEKVQPKIEYESKSEHLTEDYEELYDVPISNKVKAKNKKNKPKPVKDHPENVNDNKISNKPVKTVDEKNGCEGECLDYADFSRRSEEIKEVDVIDENIEDSESDDDVVIPVSRTKNKPECAKGLIKGKGEVCLGEENYPKPKKQVNSPSTVKTKPGKPVGNKKKVKPSKKPIKDKAESYEKEKPLQPSKPVKTVGGEHKECKGECLDYEDFSLQSGKTSEVDVIDESIEDYDSDDVVVIPVTRTKNKPECVQDMTKGKGEVCLEKNVPKPTKPTYPPKGKVKSGKPASKDEAGSYEEEKPMQPPAKPVKIEKPMQPPVKPVKTVEEEHKGCKGECTDYEGFSMQSGKTSEIDVIDENIEDYDSNDVLVIPVTRTKTTPECVQGLTKEKGEVCLEKKQNPKPAKPTSPPKVVKVKPVDKKGKPSAKPVKKTDKDTSYEYEKPKQSDKPMKTDEAGSYESEKKAYPSEKPPGNKEKGKPMKNKNANLQQKYKNNLPAESIHNEQAKFVDDSRSISDEIVDAIDPNLSDPSEDEIADEDESLEDEMESFENTEEEMDTDIPEVDEINENERADLTDVDNNSNEESPDVGKFRKLPFVLNSNMWSLIINPDAKDNKLKECVTRNNESGFCMYLQQCPVLNIASSLETLLDNACVKDEFFIGVCCPEFPVETVKVQWEDTERNSVKAGGQLDHENEDCGTRSKEASRNQSWPWKAPLLSKSNGKIFCGGLLINEEYVLTAAHCTTKIPRNQILVRLGQVDENSGEDFAVVEIKRHAQYNSRNLQNDIALLKLGQKVPHSDRIHFACLPDEDDDDDEHAGEEAILLGWKGVFGKNQKKSELLEVISNEDCRKRTNAIVLPSTLCTEPRNEDESTCNADSGAPLVVEDDDKYEVIAILSWNRNDCDQRFPSLFSRVSSYVKWIKRHAV